MAGFRGLGERARALADRHTDGKLLLVQEGGYARTYSAACLLATVGGVLGLPRPSRIRSRSCPTRRSTPRPRSTNIRAVQARHWEVLR